MDLTHFSTKELEDMQRSCKEQISKMIASPETIALCAAIEKELQSRQ